MLQSSASALTGRQRQVLTLVAKGRSNREIAGELGITEQGVKSHVSRLLLRHGVPNRTALVAATRSWSASPAALNEGPPSSGAASVTDRRPELSPDTLQQAAAASPDAPADVSAALGRLRDIVRELNVALEFARDLPPGESSKALVKAVRKRAVEAGKQVAMLEGAITPARR